MAATDPKDAEWPARLGMTYLADRHYLSAVESFQTALRLGAPEPPLRLALATCYSNLERHDQALAEYRRFAELSPDVLLPRLEIASEQARLGNRKEALAALEAIPLDAEGYPRLRAPGGRTGAMEQLASAYGKLEQWKRTLELARKLLNDTPDNATAQMMAGQALVALGRPVEAIPLLRAAERSARGNVNLQYLTATALLARKQPSDEPEIRRLLEAAALDGSAPGDVYFQLGLIYERQGQWERAAKAFVHSSNVRTKAVQSLQHAYTNFAKAGQKEEAVYRKGLYFETIGRFPEAIETYRVLTRMHDCCHSGFMHIARVQSGAGQHQAALSTLEGALKLPNAPPKLYAELAKAYGTVKKLEEQKAMWREFIRRDPANADLGYQNLGMLADGGGKMDEAEALYGKSIELQPDADLYRIKAAQLLLQRRNDPRKLAEAVTHLERAVKLAPENGEALFHLGVAYRYAGRGQEAIWALRHAIDIDPGEGKPYQPLGELLIAAGKKQEGQETLAMYKRFRQFFQAWETLKARVTRNPRDTSAHRQLAAFYERSGATLDAISSYAQVLAIDPSDTRARERHAALYAELGQTRADVGQLSSGTPPRNTNHALGAAANAGAIE